MEHRFIEQLKQSRSESAPLSQALIDFSTPKELTVQNFKEGVKRFIMLANMMPEERIAFFTTFIQDSLSIEHVFNDPDYRLKHPGGHNGGQNSLVIEGSMP